MVSSTASANAPASPNGTDTNPGVNGPKPRPRIGVAGEAGDGGGAAVEVVGAHDDRRPDRRALRGDGVQPHRRTTLIAVSTASAPVFIGQHHLHRAQRSERRRRRASRLSVPYARLARVNLRQLALRGRHQPGMAVPEVQRGVGGEEVEVAVAAVVLDPRPAPGGERHRQIRSSARNASRRAGQRGETPPG